MSLKKLLLSSANVFKITVVFSCARAAVIQYEVSVITFVGRTIAFLMFCSLWC